MNSPIQVPEVVHRALFKLRIVRFCSQFNITAPSKLDEARMRRRHEDSLEWGVKLVAWDRILLEVDKYRRFCTPVFILASNFCRRRHSLALLS